jgi:hypothetical protein
LGMFCKDFDFFWLRLKRETKRIQVSELLGLRLLQGARVKKIPSSSIACKKRIPPLPMRA